MAMLALSPICVPISRPRTVSIIGVKGWWAANQRRPAGIVAEGTNPLPKNGRSNSGIGLLLAVSTLRALRPSTTVSHVSASAIHASIPIAPSHCNGSAVGRKPITSATPSTIVRQPNVWIMAVTT
jgi:hypothetical protein